MPEGDPNALNKWSRKITQPKSQGASQAMLYATGLTPEQMNLPQIGASRTRGEGGRRVKKRARENARRGAMASVNGRLTVDGTCFYSS